MLKINRHTMPCADGQMLANRDTTILILSRLKQPHTHTHTHTHTQAHSLFSLTQLFPDSDDCSSDFSGCLHDYFKPRNYDEGKYWICSSLIPNPEYSPHKNKWAKSFLICINIYCCTMSTLLYGLTLLWCLFDCTTLGLCH